MRLTRLVFFLAVIFLLNSCNKDNENEIVGNIEVYLIESYSTIEPSDCAINDNTCKIYSTPLLNYSDLLSYNKSRYSFSLSKRAINSIKELDHSLSGLAFAVTADGEIVYTGYFWPGYSSLSCNWSVTDPLMIEYSGEMKIKLGYPGQFDDYPLEDKRNHPLIINAFKNDGKLIE